MDFEVAIDNDKIVFFFVIDLTHLMHIKIICDVHFTYVNVIVTVIYQVLFDRKPLSHSIFQLLLIVLNSERC